MPKIGSINEISGVYESACCHHQRAIPEGHRFPPCGTCHGKKGSLWKLVYRTKT